MSNSNSPLRYPGGKSVLKELVANIIRENGFQGCSYIEPYAGGCGLALSLLYDRDVSDIYINDLDPLIWSFWHAVLNHHVDLISLINNTSITVNEWNKQKEIQANRDISNPLELGFSTFFINRTSRSGIINGAGIIGGIDQAGTYKIDCRFNKKELSRRITRIARYKSQIHLSNLDAVDLLSRSNDFPEDTFLCIDPPYFNKGSSLYASFYDKDDHQDVSKAISAINRPWIITYDNVDPIRQLYNNYRQYRYSVNYSIQVKRLGTELFVASKCLKIPNRIIDKCKPKLVRIAQIA